jgi:hypothetical protein
MVVLLSLCLSVSFAVTVYDDGFITEGEYAYGVDWTSYDPPLIVKGGGADWIEMRENGRLEVHYTSTPLSYTAGILDIVLDDFSELLYLNGETDIITISENSNATLKGGLINHIVSRQYTSTKHIDLFCQPGWAWLYNTSNEIKGITGKWEDGFGFNITFVDDDWGWYPPVWMNINVIEIPEPTTLLLLAAGCVIIRRRRNT